MTGVSARKLIPWNSSLTPLSAGSLPLGAQLPLTRFSARSAPISAPIACSVKLAFHGADTDTDTDTDILADFRARIAATMSVRDVRVYTISYRVHVYKITRRLCPCPCRSVEFQLYEIVRAARTM